jgi:phospholipid/cholesterol/gamma-HCH transport system permease protein
VTSTESAAAADASATRAGSSAWGLEQGVWTLRLVPPWAARALDDAALPAVPGKGGRVRIDGSALGHWDAGLAAALWSLRERLQQRGLQVELASLPAGLGELLLLAQPGDVPREPAAPARPALQHALHEAGRTIAFFGEVLIALARWLSGRVTVRGTEVLQQLDQTGPRSAPIVLLTCALVGVMLAYMGGAQLERIGAQGFLAGVVTVGMVRELAGLMTGVILAGRVGAAFAAQLATMQAGEEIDALRVLGVDPIAHLVLPRLLALLLMAPALLAFGALAGITAGALPALWVYGVTPAEYLQQSLRALTATHLWIGLFKGMVYAALVVAAGCREGLHAGRSAQAVGQATTAAVVKALVWIVVAACVTTVGFTAMGF